MHAPSNMVNHIINDELSQASGGLITCFKPTLSRALDTYSVTHTRLSSTDIDFIKHHHAHKYYDA